MTPIWRLQNGQGPSWKYAQAKVESETNYQVLVRNMQLPTPIFLAERPIEFLLTCIINTLWSHRLLLQIVFEGVWGNSRVSGYTAIDDVTFFEGACSSKQTIPFQRKLALHTPSKYLISFQGGGFRICRGRLIQMYVGTYVRRKQ